MYPSLAVLHEVIQTLAVIQADSVSKLAFFGIPLELILSVVVRRGL